jgi:hypothetical protein
MADWLESTCPSVPVNEKTAHRGIMPAAIAVNTTRWLSTLVRSRDLRAPFRGVPVDIPDMATAICTSAVGGIPEILAPLIPSTVKTGLDICGLMGM